MTTIAPTATNDPPFDGVPLPPPDQEASWVQLGDRFLRQLADVQGEMAANEAACKAELQRIAQSWVECQQPLQRREARLLEYLEQIARVLPLRGKKSRKLAAGTVGWREIKPRLEVQDEPKALAWAKANAPAVVRTISTEKLDKKALDEKALVTGEVPDGCTLIDGHEKFYAKTGE